MTTGHAAPMLPRGRRVWIVRWIRADGLETRHRVFLVHHAAARYLGMLLGAGREAAMFSSAVDWTKATP